VSVCVFTLVLISSAGSVLAGRIQGRITYQDRLGGRHPVRYALVEVDVGFSPYLTATNGNGEYAIEVPNSPADDVVVFVFARGAREAFRGVDSSMANIISPDFGIAYYWSSLPQVNTLPATMYVSFNIGPDAGPFDVYDSIIEAFIKTYELLEVIPFECPVYFPDPFGGASYDPWREGGEGAMWVGREMSGARDVILHEYGHFIADGMNFGRGEVDDSRHIIGAPGNTGDLRAMAWPLMDGTIEIIRRSATQAMNLAFREAWPTVFSVGAQLGDTWYPGSGDSSVDAPFGSYDLEVLTDLQEQEPGQYFEEQTMGVLWDIFDNNNHAVDNDDSFSDVAPKFNKIWWVVVQHRPDTIQDFWNAWAAEWGDSPALRRILADHQMDLATGPVEVIDDFDGDRVADRIDNCPEDANPFQGDMDTDGIGDLCDSDVDGDGLANQIDNCALVSNPEQSDQDGDGTGDVCEEGFVPDGDGDGAPDARDNCPTIANAGQEDSDEDGLGDVCEEEALLDTDEDGVLDGIDNCPETFNARQWDMDSDGIGDACDGDVDGDDVLNIIDNCREIPNPDQEDLDADGIGSACDEDADGDGVSNIWDNCPVTPNPKQEDLDGDGRGDACAAPGDIQAPTPPEGLVATSTPSTVELDWDGNSEDDFSSYRIYRRSGGIWSMFAGEVTESRYTDREVSVGTSYQYTVTAVDSSGNESEPSIVVLVTFGVTAGGQVPGDYNQDAGVNISDGIALFSYLFLGEAGPDCPAGLDFNNDGDFNISDGIATLGYLFQGGRPHAFGVNCIPIAGCPDACN